MQLRPLLLLTACTWFLFIGPSFSNLILWWLYLADALIDLCLLLLCSACWSHFGALRSVLHDLDFEVLVFNVCIYCCLNFVLVHHLVWDILQVYCSTCPSSGLFILNLSLHMIGKVGSFFICRIIRRETRFKIRASVKAGVCLWRLWIHVKSWVCFGGGVLRYWSVSQSVWDYIGSIMSCGNVLLFLSRVYWLNLIHCDVVTDRVLLCHYLLLVGDLAMLTDLRNSVASTHWNGVVLCKYVHVLWMWREILNHGNTPLRVVVLATICTEVKSWSIFRVRKHVLDWLGRVFSDVLLCFNWWLTVTCHAAISRALSIHLPGKVSFWTSNFWWSLRDYWFTAFVFEPLKTMWDIMLTYICHL